MDALFCTHCGARQYGTEAADENPPADIQPDWEEKGHLFNLPSLFITVRDVLFTPVLTFRYLNRTPHLFNALLFAVLCGSVGFLLNSLWQSLMDFRQYLPQGYEIPVFLSSAGVKLAMIFIVPLGIAVGLFIGAGLCHLFLLLTGGAKQPFAVTFKVTAYAYGSTSLLGFIPVLGTVAGAVWAVIIQIAGLKEAHRTSYIRVILAVCLPAIGCCCCAAAGVVLLLTGLSFSGLSGLF